MYEIEVTVTASTPTEFKVTASWPLVWLQAPGSIEILRKLFPGEIVTPVTEPIKRLELPVIRTPQWDLQLGGRVMARCFFKGESSG